MTNYQKGNIVHRLDEADKAQVIDAAGPHRTVNFRFERLDGVAQNRLICVGASIKRSGNETALVEE